MAGAGSLAADVVVGVLACVIGVGVVRVGAVGAAGAEPALVVGVLGAVGTVRAGAVGAAGVGAGVARRTGAGVARRTGAGVAGRAGAPVVPGILGVGVAGMEEEGGLVVANVSNFHDLSSTRTLTIWELMVELNTLALLLSCMVSFIFPNRNNEDSLTYTVMLQCT